MPLPFRSLTADHTDHNDSHLIIAGVTVLLSVLIHTGIGVAAGDARLDFFSPKTVHPEAWREGLRDEPVRARIVQPPPTQEQFAETCAFVRKVGRPRAARTPARGGSRDAPGGCRHRGARHAL